MRPFVSGVFALALSAMLCMPAFSQTVLKDTQAARELSDQMMKLIAAGDMEAGIRLAKPYLVIPDAELEAMIGQAKLQAPMLAQRFGKPIGSEFIREERAGENLLRILQICRHEKHVTRWSFYFYRGAAGWVLNTFNFDDNIKAVF